MADPTRLTLGARWPSIDPSDRLVLRSDIRLAADRRELEEAWNAAVKPHLNEFYALLWPILTSQLLTAHELLRATRAIDGYDPLSAARSAIEPHEQDTHKDEWIVLIDMTRDVLEWMVEHEPAVATRVIDHRLNSESLILQRVAIQWNARGLASRRPRGPDSFGSATGCSNFRLSTRYFDYWRRAFPLRTEHNSSRSSTAYCPSQSLKFTTRRIGASLTMSATIFFTG